MHCLRALLVAWLFWVGLHRQPLPRRTHTIAPCLQRPHLLSFWFIFHARCYPGACTQSDSMKTRKGTWNNLVFTIKFTNWITKKATTWKFNHGLVHWRGHAHLFVHSYVWQNTWYFANGLDAAHFLWIGWNCHCYICIAVSSALLGTTLQAIYQNWKANKKGCCCLARNWRWKIRMVETAHLVVWNHGSFYAVFVQFRNTIRYCTLGRSRIFGCASDTNIGTCIVQCAGCNETQIVFLLATMGGMFYQFGILLLYAGCVGYTNAAKEHSTDVCSLCHICISTINVPKYAIAMEWGNCAIFDINMDCSLQEQICETSFGQLLRVFWLDHSSWPL